MRALILLYIVISTFLSFWDFEIDGETSYSVKSSFIWQTFYMSEEQMKVYFSDLGMLPVRSDMALDGLEVGDIHDIANSERRKRGMDEVEYPWQGPFSFAYTTYIRPAILLAVDSNAVEFEMGKSLLKQEMAL